MIDLEENLVAELIEIRRDIDNILMFDLTLRGETKAVLNKLARRISIKESKQRANSKAKERYEDNKLKKK